MGEKLKLKTFDNGVVKGEIRGGGAGPAGGHGEGSQQSRDFSQPHRPLAPHWQAARGIL